MTHKATQDFRMEERKAPIRVPWDKPGDNVQGILVKLETIELEKDSGKKVPKATLLDIESGQPYEFLLPYDLAQKIHLSDRGRLIIVRFEQENPNITKNGNRMKEFSVRVSDRKVEIDSLQITDADIPF